MDVNPYDNPALGGDQYTDGVNIVELDEPPVGEDLLYDLREHLQAIGSEAFSARVEIERRHSLQYENYVPEFTVDELTGIVSTLLVVKTVHSHRGNDEIVRVLEDLGRALADSSGEAVSESVVSSLQGIEPHDGDVIRIFDALSGKQDVTFKEEYLEQALQGDL